MAVTDVGVFFNKSQGGNVKVTGHGNSCAVETTHEYRDYGRVEGSIEFDVAETLQVKFDSQCVTESGCDWLAFYATEEDLRNSNKMPGCYFSGSDFKNKECTIPGTCDSSKPFVVVAN